MLQADLSRRVNSEAVQHAEASKAGQGADTPAVRASSVEFVAQSASLAAAVITFLSNLVLKRVCQSLTKREKHATKTGYEMGLYLKLAVAYAVNTCGVPFLARVIDSLRSNYFKGYRRDFYSQDTDTFSQDSPGSDAQQPSVIINQDWFESNGFTGYIFISLIGMSMLSEVGGMFRPKSIFNRYIRARFITSQHKLNRLWKPPRMPVGRLYANVVKDVSLCIIYGPIFPLAYLLTAVRLALSFWTNLFTITYFFGRPAALTEKMMTSMTSGFFCLCLGALCTKFFAYERQNLWPLLASQHGQSAPPSLPWHSPSSPPVPPQGAPGGSGIARHSQSEAQPLGAQPPPRVLERAASRVADLTAFAPPGLGRHAPVLLPDLPHARDALARRVQPAR